MLFQKEKDYGNTITKIGRKKNKKNETAKKKRKIKKERKCSLKNRILASSMVRRISNLFLKSIFLCLEQKGESGAGNSTCASYVFVGNGDDDLFYGYLPDSDRTSAGIM